MSSKTRDNRKHNRIRFNSDITIHPVMKTLSGGDLEVQSESIWAKGRDLTEEGLRMEMGDTHAASDIMKVKFEVEKFKKVDGYARLAWRKGRSYGLQFIVLDHDSREQIRKYISKQS